MSVIEAIILGIVEGVTEFLPISSTAHLMMTSEILNITQSEFVKSFEIVIQLGAVLAVLFVFGRHLIRNPGLWKKIIVAFVPTAIIGFLLYELIKSSLIGNLHIAVWSLVIGGIALIATEKIIAKRAPLLPEKVPHKGEEISTRQAFVIGVVQSLAVIPGVSRSATTIVPALLFGASRETATEFSFLLAIPTIAAAAGYDLLKNLGSLDGNISILSVGFVTSFIAAIVSIKFLLSFIKSRTFTSFGIYRIIVAILFLLIFL